MEQVQLFNQGLLTKDGIKDLSNQIISSLDEGNFNPLDFKLAAKGFEKLIESVKEQIDEAAMTEAAKYGQKTFSYKGSEIQVVDNLGVSYDYSECNHPQYNAVMEEFNRISKLKKDLEGELQATKTSRTMIDESTGEVVTVYPPRKRSKSGIKITIK